jgi:hypothetical protein
MKKKLLPSEATDVAAPYAHAWLRPRAGGATALLVA